MNERPNIEDDPQGWFAWMRERDAQPVTVTGPAGELTFRYQNYIHLLSDLLEAYNFLADLPEDLPGVDDYAQRRTILLDRLQEQDLFVRPFLREDDLPWEAI